MARSARVLDGLTDEAARADRRRRRAGLAAGGRSFSVRECLLTVLNEEWHHRVYAERDLALLEAAD